MMDFDHAVDDLIESSLPGGSHRRNQSEHCMTSRELICLLSLILFSNLWVLVMTALPVAANIGPDNYYAGHPGWYTGDDVIRFIEPVFGFPLQFAIFNMRAVFDSSKTHSTTTLCYFMFYGALYVQGAAFHSASNMFKAAVNSIAEVHDDDIVMDTKYWMRTVWEHIVSHYIYGGGLCVLFAFQQWAYKDAMYTVLESISAVNDNNNNSPAGAGADNLEDGGRFRRVRERTHTPTVVEMTHNDTRLNMKLLINGLICTSALAHGLAIAASAIDFPSGVYIGLAYVVAGFIVTVYYLFITASDRKPINTSSSVDNYAKLTAWERVVQELLDVSVNMHRRPIMMYFLWGFVVAIITLLVWIGVHGPVSRSQAGVM